MQNAMKLKKEVTFALLQFYITFTHESFHESEAKKTDDFGELIQYRDGQIIIAAFINVGQRDIGTGKCINVFNNFGPIAIEEIAMTVDKINNDSTLLKGVKIGTLVINTCGSAPHALKKLILNVVQTYVLGEEHQFGDTEVRPKRILAGIVGAVRSAVSTSMARILQIYNISQISFWSTSPELSDKSRFKYFFRTCPPDTYQALGMAEFAKVSGWNYVSIVYAGDEYGQAAKKEMVHYLRRKQICIATEVRILLDKARIDANSVIEQLLLHKNAKAVFLITSPYVAETIIRTAHETPGARSTFTWFGADFWTGLIPTKSNDRSYLDTLNGATGFRLAFPHTTGFDKYIATLKLEDRQGKNKILNPWWEHFIASINNCSLENDTTEKRLCGSNEVLDPKAMFSTGVSTSFLAFAHALNSYIHDECGEVQGLCQKIAISAGTDKVATGLYEYLKKVSFPTNTGTFHFDENQDGPPIYNVEVFDKNRTSDQSVLAGWSETAIFVEQNVTWNNLKYKKKHLEVISLCSLPCKPGQIKALRQQTCCWSCLTCSKYQYVANGRECKDCDVGYLPNKAMNECIAMPVRRLEYNSGCGIIVLGVGILGLVCTLIVAVIYFKNRDTPIVRASGKELCFFVQFGIFFTLLDCFTIFATPSPVICGVTRTIFCIGPVLIYAGLLMKTFRVVFIFQSKGILSMRTKAYLEPVPLTLITLSICLLQVAICILWMVIKPPQAKVYYFGDEGYLACKNLLEVQIFAGLAYPFIIIVICTILATINRNVPTGFRETLFVGFSMYITCVTWIAFLPLFLTNPADILKKETTVSLALSVSAMAILFCLFVPRCYTILFHPGVNTTESVMASRGSYSTNVRRPTLTDAGDEERRDERRK